MGYLKRGGQYKSLFFLIHEIYKIIRNLETSSFLFYQALKVLLDVE